MTINDILEDVTQQMCDNYCKYPLMGPPEGEGDEWLFASDNSPCNECPLNNLT